MEPSLKGFAQNQLWCEIVALACELLAWTQMLALPGTAAAGSRNGSGCACSPSPGASPAAAAACGSDSPDAGPGPARSPPPSPACRPYRPAYPAGTIPATGKEQPQGPWNPAHSPGATAGQPDTTCIRKSPPAEQFRPARQARERSRLDS